MVTKDESKDGEPEWLDPSHDRKTPYTDEELELFVADFMANMTDVRAWNALVQEVGEETAKQILKERFMALDHKNLINWHPRGPAS